MWLTALESCYTKVLGTNFCFASLLQRWMDWHSICSVPEHKSKQRAAILVGVFTAALWRAPVLGWTGSSGDTPCEQQPGSLWHGLSLGCRCLQCPELLWGCPSSGGNRNLFTLCFLAMSLWLLHSPVCISSHSSYEMLINLQG